MKYCKKKKPPFAKPLAEPVTLAYIEDHQGVSKSVVIFRTNSPMRMEQLSRLSWQPQTSGRISTKYSTFAKALRGLGYSCERVERLAEGVSAPVGMPQVIGATGNY